MSANNRIRFVSKIVFVCLYITQSHYHHCANLSEDIQSINACQIYLVECVSKMRHILLVIHYTIRGSVCFQFTHFLVTIERIYIPCLIIIIKSEVWTITHCLGLGHETMMCVVCLSVFLWERFNTLITVYVQTTFSNALFKEDLCILFWISRKTLSKCAICYELSMAQVNGLTSTGDQLLPMGNQCTGAYIRHQPSSILCPYTRLLPLDNGLISKFTSHRTAE